MAIEYKIVTIENYADDAATEAALNAEGAGDWNTDIKNSKPNPVPKTPALLTGAGTLDNVERIKPGAAFNV